MCIHTSMPLYFTLRIPLDKCCRFYTQRQSISITIRRIIATDCLKGRPKCFSHVDRWDGRSTSQVNPFVAQVGRNPPFNIHTACKPLTIYFNALHSMAGALILKALVAVLCLTLCAFASPFDKIREATTRLTDIQQQALENAYKVLGGTLSDGMNRASACNRETVAVRKELWVPSVNIYLYNYTNTL